jgi:hypothetical protein
LAIHAGINAADAVCGARLGERAAGEDHEQVLALLRQAGSDGTKIEKELRRLLPLKTKAEYEPDDARLQSPRKRSSAHDDASPWLAQQQRARHRHPAAFASTPNAGATM